MTKLEELIHTESVGEPSVVRPKTISIDPDATVEDVIKLHEEAKLDLEAALKEHAETKALIAPLLRIMGDAKVRAINATSRCRSYGDWIEKRNPSIGKKRGTDR